jgi:uncharacterized NAD-dependent epimerase/dehydratase family protein
VSGMPGFPLPGLKRTREMYEAAAEIMHPCRVIGVAMNSHKFSDDQADRERERVRRELGLPVCDVIRHGPDELVEAVLGLKRDLKK